MKTSLLLTGLLLGTGIVGTAQATDVSACQHLVNIQGQSLTAASTSGNGMLSDLSNLLSGQKKKADSAGAGSHSTDLNAHAAPTYRHQPGPIPAAAHQASHHAGHANHDSATAPMAIGDGGNPPPVNATPDNPPTLGWQSLLPGSIQ